MQKLGELLIVSGLAKRLGLSLWNWARGRHGKGSLRYLRRKETKVKKMLLQFREMAADGMDVRRLIKSKEAQLATIREKIGIKLAEIAAETDDIPTLSED